MRAILTLATGVAVLSVFVAVMPEAAAANCTDQACCSTYEWGTQYFDDCLECVALAPLTYWNTETNRCVLN